MLNINKEKYLKEAVFLRRELHKIPEAGFDEHETQAFIIKTLESFSLEHKDTAETGLLCYFDANSSETIAFRSDMDALPISEENDVSYKSLNEGYMHACGHDGHMTILLLLAKFLSEEKINLKKNILLIFQPAEEGPGGAKKIIEENVLEKYHVKNMFSLHINPSYKEGSIYSKAKEFYAGSHILKITVNGKASHAAMPKKGIDAIEIASRLILKIKEYSNKNNDTVISICTFNSGKTNNIISDKAELTGTLRSFFENEENNAIKFINEVSRNLEKEYGCKIKCEFEKGYPVLINDEKLLDKIKPCLAEWYEDAEKTMVVEDFAYFALKIPSVYFMLGSKNKDKEFVYPLHSSKFNFDESILVTALQAYISILQTLNAI